MQRKIFSVVSNAMRKESLEKNKVLEFISIDEMKMKSGVLSVHGTAE